MLQAHQAEVQSIKAASVQKFKELLSQQHQHVQQQQHHMNSRLPQGIRDVHMVLPKPAASAMPPLTNSSSHNMLAPPGSDDSLL